MTKQILEEIRVFERFDFARFLSDLHTYNEDIYRDPELCMSGSYEEILMMIELNIEIDNILLKESFEINILSKTDT
jgi:hypothetical protein